MDIFDGMAARHFN